MSLTSKDLAKVGVIVNSFGNTGKVKLLISRDYEFNCKANLQNKLLFYRDNNKILQPLKITGAMQSEPNLLILGLEGFNTIDDASKLKGKEITSIIADKIFVKKQDYKDYRLLFEDQNWLVLDTMETPANLLVKVKVARTPLWIPIVDEYVEKIDDDLKLIYAKNVGRLF